MNPFNESRSVTFAMRWARLRALAESPLLGYLVGLAYLLALVYLGLRFHLMGDGDSESDFFEAYVVQARAFLDGGIEIDPYRGPVYPVILAVLHVLLRPLGLGLFETGIVLSALAASAAIVIIYRLLRSLFDSSFSLVTILLVISSTYFVRYSYTTGNDMLFVSFAVGTMYLFLRESNKPSWRVIVLVGVLCGVTYLIRYNGIAIILGIAASILFVNVWHLSWTRRTAATLAVVAAFIAAIVPWGLYCRSEKGSFFYNHNYVNVTYPFYLPEGEKPEEFLNRNAEAFNSIIDVVTYDPAVFVSRLPQRSYEQLKGLMTGVVTWPVACAVALGVLSLLFRRPSRRELSYYVMGLTFFWGLSFVFFNSRFNLLLIPVCAVLAVRGVIILSRYVCRVYARHGAAILLAALIAHSAVVAFAHNHTTLPGGLIAFRRMGEWLADNTPADRINGIVVARKPYFSYFSNLNHVRLPRVKSYDELIAFLEDADADYLFFSYVAAKTRPELGFLMDPTPEHPPLKPLLRGPVAVLYEIEKSGQRR